MADSPHFRIGTRGSDLAMWQAHHVRDLILAHGGTCDITVLSTQGDREQVQAFEKLEGKGFFTKEIEQALLEDRIDLAVHSHKDLETRQPDGLCIAAVPERAAAEDVLLIHPRAHRSAPWLPLLSGAVVGTSSVRRRDQLLLLRPDLDIQPLRGNVPTRVQRLKEGRYDAIVLAAAGLDRLDLDLGDLLTVRMDPRHFVPAPAQGALALQMRENDGRVEWLSQLSAPDVPEAIEAERSVLRALEGGCQLPFGAHQPTPDALLRCFLQTEQGPRRIVAPSAQEALDRLEDQPSRRLVITRVPKPGDALHRLATGSGHELIEWPAALPIPLTDSTFPPSDIQWIWLGSPGAARVMAKWLVDHPHIHIATAGPGTADALSEELKQRIAHCGNGEPQGAMDTFLKGRTEGEAVGLPHSEVSLRRWENVDTLAELHPWVAYTMEPNEEIPPGGDVVCFTSPSNVRAWTGTEPERIVALGTTTSEALTERGWAHQVAEHPDAFGVWEALQEC